MGLRTTRAIELAGSGADGHRRALDLSAGDGASSRLLSARGWQVVPTELRPAAPGWVAADLSSYFPFRETSFDLVVMLEVIEHLENIPHAFREIARVLRPGGRAIVSTPNRLNASSRIHHLLTGFYKGRRAPLPYRYRTSDGRNWNVMGLNDLHWIAWGAGLQMDAIGPTRRKLKSVIYGALFYVPIKLASWLLYGRGAPEPNQDRINRELFRFMTGPSLLLDENLLMSFHKSDAVATTVTAGAHTP